MSARTPDEPTNPVQEKQNNHTPAACPSSVFAAPALCDITTVASMAQVASPHRRSRYERQRDEREYQHLSGYTQRPSQAQHHYHQAPQMQNLYSMTMQSGSGQQRSALPSEPAQRRQSQARALMNLQTLHQRGNAQHQHMYGAHQSSPFTQNGSMGFHHGNESDHARMHAQHMHYQHQHQLHRSPMQGHGGPSVHQQYRAPNNMQNMVLRAHGLQGLYQPMNVAQRSALDSGNNSMRKGGRKQSNHRCKHPSCNSSFNSKTELRAHQKSYHSLEATESRERALHNELQQVEQNHAILREYSNMLRKLLASAQVKVPRMINPFNLYGSRPKRLFRSSKAKAAASSRQCDGDDDLESLSTSNGEEPDIEDSDGDESGGDNTTQGARSRKRRSSSEAEQDERMARAAAAILSREALAADRKRSKLEP